MAEITPINEIPDFDKHQLQQILLERDESIERLEKIQELEQVISDLMKEKDKMKEDHSLEKEEFETKILADAIKQVKDIHDEKLALLEQNSALSSTLKSIEGTPQFIAAKMAQAEALQAKAQEILSKIQPQEKE